MINCCFLLVSALIIGANSTTDLSSNISSNSASYDGDYLRLVGNVKLNHDLGQIQANQAILKKGRKELPFSNMFLEKDVFFSFQNESELFCDKAELDFIHKLGTVLSHDKYVLYRNHKDKPLNISSRQIDFYFKEKDHHDLEIHSLIAKEAVHIDYDDKYHLDADEARFTDEILFAYQITQPCNLLHSQDRIEARQIAIYRENYQLQIDEPKGKVSSFFFPDAPNRLCNFTAQYLCWDHLQHVMSLYKNIQIQDDFLGTIEGKEIVRFHQRQHFGKYVIQSIEAKGETVLRSTDVLEPHTLTSFGLLSLDRDRLCIIGSSPKIDNQVPLDKQLIFVKGNLTLFADNAIIEYNICQMKLQPIFVHLFGHVRLLSSKPETPFKCGYADHVYLDPQTKQIRLLAESGKRVLFWHEEQNLKLSAHEVVVIPDSELGKDIVKGIGNVCFSFNEKQQEILHKFFPLRKL